jgi:hypothetical protein
VSATRPPRRARRRAALRSVAGALSAVTLLTACGATATVRNGQTLSVSLSEYRVAPQSIDAPSGLLTLAVHNNGRLSHDLVISRDGAVQAATPPLSPGQGAVLTAVLAPGTYEIASTLNSDEALGAYGTLRVGR